MSRPERHSHTVPGGRAYWLTQKLWAAAAGLPVIQVAIADIPEFDRDCWFRGQAPSLRDVAGRVGITERAVQRIVADLEHGRYIERVRTGRRNRYKVHPEMPLRHPIEAHRKIASLIHLVVES